MGSTFLYVANDHEELRASKQSVFHNTYTILDELRSSFCSLIHTYISSQRPVTREDLVVVDDKLHYLPNVARCGCTPRIASLRLSSTKGKGTRPSRLSFGWLVAGLSEHMFIIKLSTVWEGHMKVKTWGTSAWINGDAAVHAPSMLGPCKSFASEPPKFCGKVLRKFRAEP